MKEQNTAQGKVVVENVTSEKKPFTPPLLEKKDVALTEAGAPGPHFDFAAYSS